MSAASGPPTVRRAGRRASTRSGRRCERRRSASYLGTPSHRLDRLVEDQGRDLRVLPVDHEGRGQADRALAAAGEKQAAAERLLEDGLAQLGGGGAALLVLHDL